MCWRTWPKREDKCYVWVHVTYSGVGKLLPITGNMNSEKYINTLDEFLWPVVTKQFGNSPFIFQDDNAPCHAS